MIVWYWALPIYITFQSKTNEHIIWFINFYEKYQQFLSQRKQIIKTSGVSICMSWSFMRTLISPANEILISNINRLIERWKRNFSAAIDLLKYLKCDVSIMISAGRLTLQHLLKSAGARHTSYTLPHLLNSSLSSSCAINYCTKHIWYNNHIKKCIYTMLM